jgi:YYY domain-containing protein
MIEAYYILAWWLVASIIGWFSFPLVSKFANVLPDRGWSVSRSAGLLLAGYIVWLLGSFGLLNLAQGGAFVALLALVGVGTYLYLSNPSNDWQWLKQNLIRILWQEVVFVLFFLLMAYIRALNPDISGTEKPMEFAFFNSILRSAQMPPPDPWLSGYAISYYYFGYVIMAVVTKLTAVPSAYAFNLAIALTYALAAMGAFGLVNNLIVLAKAQLGTTEKSSTVPGAIRFFTSPFALLAPVMLLVTGNLNGFLEVLFQRGWFNEAFWKGLKILPFTENAFVTGNTAWAPSRYYWWWASSRVVRDLDLNWNITGNEVIDEFPFFSFLLGDLHPHVLNLPFVLLAITFALCVFLQAKTFESQRMPQFKGRWSVFNQFPLPLSWLMAGGVLLGGLSFLNTWDFPFYLFVVTAAFVLGVSTQRGWNVDAFLQGTLAFLGWLVVGVVLYLPFYIGFRSQASGILPNPVYSTTLTHFFVMFGTSLVPILFFLTLLLIKNRDQLHLNAGLLSGPAVWGGLALGCVFLSIVVSRIRPDAAGLVLGGLSFSEALPQLLARRWLGVHGLTLVVVPMLFAVGALALPKSKTPAPAKAQAPATPNILPFVFILILTGALLVLAPDYVYLRDGFGTRMNTIFKFYYQAWLLWAMAGAFAIWYLWAAGQLNLLLRLGVLIASLGVLWAGLFYPTFSLWEKTNQFKGTTRVNEKNVATLNGLAFVQTYEPDEYAAVQWMNEHVQGNAVIAEAVGGSYSGFARIATRTGLSNVLGWPGHEVQWRGGAEEMGNRNADIDLLYQTGDWFTAQSILDSYQIDYVIVGQRERERFDEGGFVKFAENMQLVFDTANVQIYGRGD